MTATARSEWGVWYTNGEMSFGWLAREGGNGRTHTIEVDTKEEAEEIARLNSCDGDEHVYGAVSFFRLDSKDAMEALRQKARARQRARWA